MQQVFLAFLFSIQWVFAQQQNDQYLLRFSDSAKVSDKNVQSHLPEGVEFVEWVEENLALVRATQEKAVKSPAINKRSIQSIQPNNIYRLESSTVLPNDAEFSKQWNLNDGYEQLDGESVDVNVMPAWEVENGRSEVIVAVVDTGIKMDHPDLKNQLWVNQAEQNGLPGVDDDGNGYIDDIHGFDFTTTGLNDTWGHGTHVSGIVAAEKGNRRGISGVAPGVKIMPIKIFGKSDFSYEHRILKAFDYAIKNGAKVINCSFQSDNRSEELVRKIKEAEAQGVMIVTSAGNNAKNNDTYEHYPSDYEMDNVLAVAAINQEGVLPKYRTSSGRWAGSHWGMKSVDIAAPGWGVYSTYTNAAGYRVLNGTSMAAPHVSGVAALIYSQFPGITVGEVRRRILENAKPMLSLEGKIATGGLLDAHAALMDHQPVKKMTIKTLRVSGIESPHRYPAYANIVKKYSRDNTHQMRVYFERIDVEKGKDFIYLKDANGEIIQRITGKARGYWSKPIPGGEVTIQLRSDRRRQRYGYKATRVKVWERR